MEPPKPPTKSGTVRRPPLVEAPTGDWGAGQTQPLEGESQVPVPRPSGVTLVNGERAVADPPTDSQPSFGQYELLGELARGGMGVVYRARQKGLNRVVALKMVLASQLGHGSTAERFLQEARAAAALDHPNVVSVYDSGELNGQVYFTMTFVDGADLRNHVAEHGLLPVGEVLSLFAQIVSGVAHAHEKGIIHRDLKPANVLLDRGGRPRVTDFGLAKWTSSDSQLTGTGQIMGTPAYMPPEQARGAKNVGPAADVYSLGGILYFLLTGRPPFEGESIPELLIKLVSDAPEPPRAINPAVPPEVEALCLRCLAKDPADRFPDAQALLDALMPVADPHLSRGSTSRLSGIVVRSGDRLAASAPATVTHIETPAWPADPEGRVKNKLPLLAAVALSCLAVGGVLAYFQPWKGRPAAPVATSGDLPPHPTATPPDGSADADKTAWPAVARGDFDLKVEFVAPADKTANGVFVLADKTPLTIRLTAARNCNAAVWVIDTDGIPMQLFPSEYEPDARLTAGQTRTVPGKAGYEMVATPTKGAGFEQVRVVATTGPLPPFPAGEKVGGTAYAALTTQKDREQLASSVRGIVLKKTGPQTASADAQTSQAELKFRVR